MTSESSDIEKLLTKLRALCTERVNAVISIHQLPFNMKKPVAVLARRKPGPYRGSDLNPSSRGAREANLEE
jgi:hypothetical protein